MKITKKLSFILLAILSFAICLVFLTACNQTADSEVPHEYFAGNCLQKGFTRYYMPNGSYIDKSDDEFGPHSYEEELVQTLSCTQDGIIKYKCKICSDVYTQTQTHTGHSYEETVIQKPTCTQKGIKTLKCHKCNDSVTQYIDALPHDYKQTDHKDSTCTVKGCTTYKCNDCGADYTEHLELTEHNYTVTDHSDPTCTKDGYTSYECSSCGNKYTKTIAKSEHNYESNVIKQPTCTEQGLNQLICKNCGDIKTENIDVLPHTPAGELLHDNDGHWQLCSECQTKCGYTLHTFDNKTVEATCIEHEHIRHICRECAFEYTDTNNSSPLAAHVYEAYTCKVCQRDQMLDYLGEFNGKGYNQNNAIVIKSSDMLTLFLDYLIFYQITESKFVKISYLALKISDVSPFLAQAQHSATTTNWNTNVKYYYNKITNDVVCLEISAANSGNFVFDNAATISPDTYDANTYVQYNSYQYSTDTSSRTENFDDFAYYSRLNKVSVTSSDQLFYAFEHGYKPIPAENSPAEKMLNKAKIVARRIISDDMTELEKVRAVYTYLVSDVAYDQGIINLPSEKTQQFSKYTSYYLEGVFDYGIAVCDGISKAFCVLAGLENIKCIRVTSGDHAWNKVYIDANGDGQKQWYNSDSTWGNQSLRYGDEYGEYLTVNYFLFTDAKHTADGRQDATNYNGTNSTASDNENPFEHFYYGEGKTADNDYVITSESELTALITYMKDNFYNFERTDKISVQMFVLSTYCNPDNINIAVRNALRSISFVCFYTVSINDENLSYGNDNGFAVSIILHRTSNP